jgi:diguanylate cyclase (GGDEF)-like protein
VILPSTPKKEAMLVAERVQRTIRKELGNGKQNMESVTTSIGIASFSDDGASPGEIINAARTALSRAEAAGGNRIFVNESKSD